MADLAKTKTARADQKRKVTRCINKFKSSLVYCSDYEVLKEKADTLESEYDSLQDLHEQCKELGVGDEDYLLEITNSFQECMKLYFSSVKAEKERKLSIEVAPLKTIIEREFSRVQTILERIQMTLGLNSSEVEEHHIFEVGEDLAMMSSRIDVLSGNVADLTKLVEGDDDLEKKVSSLLNRSDKISRDARVFIKKYQNKESFQHSVSSLNKETISNPPSDHVIQVSDTLTPSATPLTSEPIQSLNPQATAFLPSFSTGSPTSVVTATQTRTLKLCLLLSFLCLIL